MQHNSKNFFGAAVRSHSSPVYQHGFDFHRAAEEVSVSLPALAVRVDGGIADSDFCPVLSVVVLAAGPVAVRLAGLRQPPR